MVGKTCRKSFCWLRNSSLANGEKEWEDDGELEQLRLKQRDRKGVAALALGCGELRTRGRVKSALTLHCSSSRRLLCWQNAGWKGRRKLIDSKESSKWKWIIEEQTVIVEGDLINCFRARQGAKSQILCCHKSQKSGKNNKSYAFFPPFPLRKCLIGATWENNQLGWYKLC